MKKALSIFAGLAMITAVGTANAATVYDNDGLSYKVKGDWQIQFRQDPGLEQDLDVEYDDLEVKNAIEYDLDNGLSAFGELHFGFKNAAEAGADPHLEEAFVGMKFNDFKVYYGKTNSAANDFGVAGAKEDPVAFTAFDEFGAVSGDDLVAVAFENDMIYVVGSYEIAAESEGSDDVEFADIYAEVNFAGATIGAAYQSYTADPNPAAGDEDSDNIWGLSAAYDAKVVAVAVDYSVYDSEDDDTDTDIGVYNVYVSAPINTLTVGFGVQGMLFSGDNDDNDVNGWYAHAIYNFPAQKNVSVFAEICDSDAGNDDDDYDMGYLLGMRIKF